MPAPHAAYSASPVTSTFGERKMIAYSKSIIFRIVILIQWSAMLYLCGDTAIIIYAQTQLGGCYPRGCFPVRYYETIPTFLFEVLAFLIIFNVLKKNWLFMPYLILAFIVICVAILDFLPFVPPFMMGDAIVVCYALLFAYTSFEMIRFRSLPIQCMKKAEQDDGANRPQRV